MLLGSQALTNDPYFNNVSLLLSARDGLIKDYSKNNHSISVNGNTAISSSQAYFGNKSIYFDGSGDYLTISSSSDFAFGTGDLTIEGWFYFQSTTDITLVGYASSNANGFCIFQDQAGQRRVYFGTTPIMFLSGSFPQNTWTHIALTRHGTTLRLFQDGVKIGEISDSSNVTATVFQVGKSLYNDYKGFNSELRITRGIARSIQVPTQPFPNW